MTALAGRPRADGESEIVDLLLVCNMPKARRATERRVGDRQRSYGARISLGWMLYGPSGENGPVKYITVKVNLLNKE